MCNQLKWNDEKADDRCSAFSVEFSCFNSIRHFALQSREKEIMTEEKFSQKFYYLERAWQEKKSMRIVCILEKQQRIARGTKRRKKSIQNRALKRFFPFCDCIKNAKHSELFIIFSLSGRR